MEAALEVQKHAYAPYSQFLVGSALEDGAGKIYSGCNVENASYSVTICGERAALGNLVSAGGTSISRVALVTSSDEPCLPCGVCLQALREFAQPETEILAVSSDGHTLIRKTLGEIFPAGFTRQQLERP